MTSKPARRSGRPSLVVVVALLAALVVPSLSLGAAGAEEEFAPKLGGYRGNAMGWAFAVRPFLPALLPTGDVPFEATLAFTSANVSSGGNSFARSSSVWFGAAAANLGPALAVARPDDLGPIASDVLPPYPLVAEASASDGTVEKGVPNVMPIVASGSPEKSEATARIPDVDIPGLLRIDSVASRSVSRVTELETRSESEVVLEGVSILGDHITIRSIHSLARTSSDGTKSLSDGDVKVVGLKVGGIPVGVDGQGLTAPDQAPIPGVDATEAANAILEQIGASLSLTRGSGGSEGAAGDRVSSGLLLSIDNPEIDLSPLASLPLPVPLALPPGRIDITLASTAADSLASPPFEFDFDDGLAQDLLGDSFGGGDGAALDAFDEYPSAVLGTLESMGADMPVQGAPPDASLLPGDVSGGSAKPIAYRFGGLPIGLVLMLLAVTIFGARFLRNAMARLLPARAISATRKE